MGAPGAGGARRLARARGRERRDAARVPRDRRARRRPRDELARGARRSGGRDRGARPGRAPAQVRPSRAGGLRRDAPARGGLRARRPRAGRVPGGRRAARRPCSLRVAGHVAGRPSKPKAVVVTAGPWARQLLAQAGIDLQVVETRETVLFFRLERETPVPVDRDDGRQPARLLLGLRPGLRAQGRPPQVGDPGRSRRGRRPRPGDRRRGHRVGRPDVLARPAGAGRGPDLLLHEHRRRQLRPRAARPDRRRLGLLRPRVQVRPGRRRAPRRPRERKHSA